MVTSTLPLNAVPRPEVYKEVQIDWDGAPIVPSATVVFLPGTMVHPVFYAELLDRLAAEGFTVAGCTVRARQEPAQPRDVDVGRAGAQRV